MLRSNHHGPRLDKCDPSVCVCVCVCVCDPYTFLSSISCTACWFSVNALTPLSGTLCLVLHIGQVIFALFPDCCKTSRHLRQKVWLQGRSLGSWYSSKQTGHSVTAAIFNNLKKLRSFSHWFLSLYQPRHKRLFLVTFNMEVYDNAPCPTFLSSRLPNHHKVFAIIAKQWTKDIYTGRLEVGPR